MSVPKHERTEHSYEYIANARNLRKLMFIAIRRLNKSEDETETYFRKQLLKYCSQLTYYIRMGHDIYVVTDLDFKIRRIHQTKAISLANLIMEEIHFLMELYPKYIKNFEKICELSNKEVKLLKGWRKSADKVKDKFKTEFFI